LIQTIGLSDFYRLENSFKYSSSKSSFEGLTRLFFSTAPQLDKVNDFTKLLVRGLTLRELIMTMPYTSPAHQSSRVPTIVDFVNIRWIDQWCKRCNICVEICPKNSLLLTHDAIIEVTDCIRCGLCERYCPDFAIEVLPKRAADGQLPADFLASETLNLAQILAARQGQVTFAKDLKTVTSINARGSTSTATGA
jgi:2-oxoglutarate ferredoxin oxidoreductase subunit delta